MYICTGHCIHLSSVLSRFHCFLYTLSYLMKDVLMITPQLHFLIFVHLTSNVRIIFLYIPISSSQYNLISPFSSTKCISRNDAKKNLLLWKTLLRKFILFVFLANIAHLADNFIERCTLRRASCWKFIVQWLQHPFLAIHCKEKLSGL